MNDVPERTELNDKKPAGLCAFEGIDSRSGHGSILRHIERNFGRGSEFQDGGKILVLQNFSSVLKFAPPSRNSLTNLTALYCYRNRVVACPTNAERWR